MAARASMAALISQLGKLLNNSTLFDASDLQLLLDAHAFPFDVALVPKLPFYRQHEAPYENIEAGAGVYHGYDSILTEGTDYTIDLQRGIMTTPIADRRGLMIQGTAYDLWAAGADGWERIAASKIETFDFSDLQGSYKVSQPREAALQMAAQYRSKAWATQSNVERSDMTGGGDTTAERLREGMRRSMR